MRSLSALIALVIVAVVVSAQVEVDSSPRPVNMICLLAFERASASVPDLLPSTDPAESPAPAMAIDLDEAIRACASIGDWLGAAALHPEALRGSDPMELLADRCVDTDAGLGEYATCISLVHALATPSPSPSPTPIPTATPTPRPTLKPSPTQKPTPKRPKVTPAPVRTPVPARVLKRQSTTRVPSLRAAVPGATRVRYFPIKGTNHRQLNRSIQRYTRQHCGSRGLWACVETRPRFQARYVQNPFGGRCTITGVRTSAVTVAHIPQWTSPRRVPKRMAYWWSRLASHIGWHEAQHVRIFERHVAKFPSMVVGRPCGQFSRTFNRWAGSLNRAQDAFDKRDYRRQARLSSRWWREAYERFPS